jgi:hypothetical protein
MKAATKKGVRPSSRRVQPVAAAAAPKSFHRLKKRHREERETWPDGLNLRVHRALSWLKGAEAMAEAGDLDGQFLYLWIAFNAAYESELPDGERPLEQERFRSFVAKLVDLDAGAARIPDLVWHEFSGTIRRLLDTEHIHGAYWEFQRGRLSEERWRAQFEKDRKIVHRALAERRTAQVLTGVLARVYVLRNQVVHGCATWAGSVNRPQLRVCTDFLAKFVPVLVETMMDHPDTLWGDASYPVVDA